ncbi:MAG: LacI family DNA-binding transcriptional regulator [Chloroflexota bacterium]
MARRQRRADASRRVTVKDVAALAGVSTATVSRVVNDHPRVGPEVKAAVTIAIHELGYVPNPSARSLMTQRTGSIGVVVLESADRLFGDPFFGQLMLGISAGLSERDRRLVLMLAPTREEETRIERYLVSDHVDGVVLVGPHGDDPLLRNLSRRQVATVVSGRPVSGLSVSYVDAQNRAGAESAVRHLIESGRQTIATIHGTLDLPSAVDRLEGYRDALRAAGRPIDPSLEVAGEYRARTAAQATHTLLASHPDLDALFAASDSMAITAMQAIKDSGRRVPEDVAVIGFDDLPTARESVPTLSTVRQPIEAMGREMVRLVLQQIDEPGSAANQVIFATELVLRGSTGDTDEDRASAPAGEAPRSGARPVVEPA